MSRLPWLVVLAVALAVPAAPAAAQAGPPATFVIQAPGVPRDVRAGIDYATHRLAQYLSSPVSITVEITWESLGSQVGGIGSSGAEINFDGAPMRDVWYPSALANALAERDLNPEHPEVHVTLNSDMNWHTGPEPSTRRPDLVSTVMHEVMHGLGLNGWMRRDPQTGEGSVGAGTGYAGIYDQFVEDRGGRELLDYPAPSKQLGDALISDALYWNGPAGRRAAGGARPRLAATEGFGSYAHLRDETYPNGTANSMMTPKGERDPQRHPGPISLGMLADLGWGLGPAATLAGRSIDDACPSSVPEDGFDDVPESNVHERAIDCVVAWKVASGTSSSTYAPKRRVNRAQMASFIARLIVASGGSLPEGDDAFSDDDGAAYAAHEDSINRLAAAKIVGGRADGTYGPQDPVTRAQMATFLVRAYEYRSGRQLPATADYFPDDDASASEDMIDKAAEAGFTGGRPDGLYAPSGDVLRDQMAAFLARVLDLLADEELTSYPG